MKRAAFVLVGAAAIAIRGVPRESPSVDALEQARRAYEQESQAALSVCTSKLKSAGLRLVEKYDQAIYQAKTNGDPGRVSTMDGERKQLKAALERLEKDGVRDPIWDAVVLMSTADVRSDVPQEGLTAWFGFNEGRGRATLNAITKSAVPVGAAIWSSEKGEVALDFRHDHAALTALNINLGAEWTVLVRARFPMELKHQWSSLLVGGVGRHHAIVSQSGELGVFNGAFVASGASVKPLNGWHTLAIRAAGGKTTFWIDGSLEGMASAAIEGPIDTFGNAPWFAGESQTSGILMDGLAVYNRALLDEQIAAIGNRKF